MISGETNNKPRPYWHVDVKWIFGIFSTFFLSVSLLLFIFSTLTSEKIAIPLGTYIVASQFSRNGLDDPKEIEEAKKKFLKSGQDVFYPLGDKNVKITKDELETLSPREIRLKIFRQIVEPYYLLGPEGVAKRTTNDQKEQQKIKNQAGLLGLINKQTHETISGIFKMSIIPAVLSLIGLVFFSYQYGRLISPAVIFLLVSVVPSTLFFLIRVTKPPLDAHGRSEGIPFLPYEVVQDLAASLAKPYYLLFLTGIGLIATTFFIQLFKRFTRKSP